MGLFRQTEIVDDDIFAIVKDILRNAQKDERVVLVTPYIKFDEKVRDCIEEALNRGVKVVLLVRKGAERNPQDSDFLGNRSVEVLELEHLHAKVYLSPSVALITSQNLYDFSDRKSKEIGVITEEGKHLRAITETVDKWLGKADRVSNRDLLLNQSDRRTDFKRSPTRTVSDSHATTSSVTQGYCISCKVTIPLNGEHPLCKAHFDSLKSRLMDYQGNYCHRCGEKYSSNHYQPFCRSCWEKMDRPKFAPQRKS